MQRHLGEEAPRRSVMFRKILVANRGEIACRVMATAKRMGIGTVAVYSDADIDAQHVAVADEAYRLGPPPVAESYLCIDRLIEICRASGAEAVHPGYGFLSENPDFVDAVDAAGVVFIGPSAAAIRAMGLKDAAKTLMEQSGVPVVPGYHGEDQDPVLLAEHASEIGYPVLIKARAGGGGKGMRRVDDPADFQTALEGAAREALASFGDDRCLIEKYLTKPRHIEIQVFGDSHGNVVHLFERDCSLQRRHQKVIEEAPAPGMTTAMRNAMGEAAVRAARAIDYAGAGTIEFIADVSDGDLRADRFYFMEMNTRLQVEHPVTEMITGQDLVEWQLRVAAGEKLPCAQDDLAIDGWAFEARVYAEDVAKGFLPATGKLDYLTFPDKGARIDSAVRQGDEIKPFYDPMIAKVIAHGGSREEALSKLQTALLRTRAVGTVTNVSFLSKLAAHRDFVRGDIDTGLIDRHLDQLINDAAPSGTAVAFAALSALGLLTKSEIKADKMVDPWDDKQGWRLWGKATQTALLARHQDLVDIKVTIEGHGFYKIVTPSETLDLRHVETEDIDLSAQIDGAKVKASALRHGDIITVFIDGKMFEWTVPDLSSSTAESDVGGDQLRAPMPGLIKLVHAHAGESVIKDMPLLVMEAMKMEHTLRAPRDGIVEQRFVDAGDQVEEGAILLQLQADQDDLR